MVSNRVILGLYWGYIAIMENEMETGIQVSLAP